MSTVEELISSEKNWQRFHEWVHCICVVTFDLEFGQAMEAIYPQHIELTEQEKMNICYLAFPDSNSGCMGNTKFHIRIRVSGGQKHTLLDKEHRKFNEHCLPTISADQGHYWGFVYFRQIKDSTLKRGYFQKSLILLTRLPFINLFYEIISIIAPKYFDIITATSSTTGNKEYEGKKCLETICSNICNWSPLIAGNNVSLKILNDTIHTFIPKKNSKTVVHVNYSDEKLLDIDLRMKQDIDGSTGESSSTSKSFSSAQSTPTSSAAATATALCLNNNNNANNNQNNIIIASINEINIFVSLSSVLTHIHLLWELVLLAEPIVVMASSPTHCSHMVQTLMSLISPLSYSAEGRPYFTIHDSEFKEFTQIHKHPPSIILGCTNPFFSKTLQQWPHLIRLNDSNPVHQQKHNNKRQHNTQNNNNSDRNGDEDNGGSQDNTLDSNNFSGADDGDSNRTAGSSIENNYMDLNEQNIIKLYQQQKHQTKRRLLDTTPGVYTQYKPYLKRDKEFLKKILIGIETKRPISVQSALLRRYLLELTQSFMIPLERYMATLMPLQKDISPFKSAPLPLQFKQDDFIATLNVSGPQLTSTRKGNWLGLYKHFFRSINFKYWYEQRYMDLKMTLQQIQLQKMSQIDLQQWVQDKHEVEIVDMILKLENKLKLLYGDDCINKRNSMNEASSASSSSSTIDGAIIPASSPSASSTASSSSSHSNTKHQIIKQLANMKNLLPDDLKNIFNS